jgi:hypothetical protein
MDCADGVILNQIGMRPLLDAFQTQCILPLSKLLFPKEGGEFTSHHSFMVQYKQGEDLGLDMHHDDSDVTLNVCLGKEFTGATLSFCGGFGTRSHRKHTHTYSHARGRGLIHLGSHRHGADDIISGERYNLIVWSTNAGWRESDEYKAINSRANLHGADAAMDEVPDPICLSFTHDPDYGEFRAYPVHKGVRRGPKPGARAMHVSRFTPSEAARRAAALKETGTADFKAKTFDAAASKYSCGADYASEAGPQAEPTLLPALLLNEAQCRLNLAEPAAAAQLCTRVLDREPENVKALYRRALAALELHDYVEARRDLVAAARLQPANRDVRKKLGECKEAADAQSKKERALMRRMMSGAGGSSHADGGDAGTGEPMASGEGDDEDFEMY